MTIKPKCLILYADNCGATNKNNYVLFFLDFIAKKLKMFQEIELCFMIPGHTKFSVDRYFGVARSKLYNFTDSIETYPEATNFIKSTSEN